MGFFTCILILIVLYCPWLIPVLFVVFILFMIYHYSPVLFAVVMGLCCVFWSCRRPEAAVWLRLIICADTLLTCKNDSREKVRRG